MNNKGNLTQERPPLLPVMIGTGFGSGFWPWGPGTAGSLLALAVWYAIATWAPLSGTQLSALTLALVLAFTLLGTWATAQLQPYWGEDPSRVVVDEMVGMWLPLSLLQPADEWWWAVVALVLFRFFDMVKPFGIRQLDRKSGAFWVMADDLLGGVYAAATMVVLKVAVAVAAG